MQDQRTEQLVESATDREPDCAAEGEKLSLGLIRSDRIFLICVGVGCCVLLGLQHWQRHRSGVETIHVQRLEHHAFLFQIQINSATWVEWMQLDGVGETTARNIVADRTHNGPFLSIEDVQRVKGIGPATLEKMRRHLACEECN